MTPDPFSIFCQQRKFTATNLCPVVHPGDEEDEDEGGVSSEDEGVPSFTTVHKAIQKKMARHKNSLTRTYDYLSKHLAKISDPEKVVSGIPPLVLSLVWLPIISKNGFQQPKIFIKGAEQWPAPIPDIMETCLMSAFKSHCGAATSIRQVGCLLGVMAQQRNSASSGRRRICFQPWVQLGCEGDCCSTHYQ